MFCLFSASRASFRQGIVQGDKHVIYPIIEWLLRRIPELKERAYLANYLVKIEVPADFMADAKIAELYEQVPIISLMCLVILFWNYYVLMCYVFCKWLNSLQILRMSLFLDIINLSVITRDILPGQWCSLTRSTFHIQYEQLIRTFTENHKQLTALNSSGFNTADIKKDIASMEEEKDQLIKRVERLKKKVDECSRKK